MIQRILLLLFFLLLSTYTWSQDSVNVSFNVNMENETVDPAGVFIAGGSQFGGPGDNPLSDPDNDGIYSTTIRIPKFTSSNYIFTNGNCPDFSCKESLFGKLCADTANNNDRFFPPVTTDTTISTCFSQCSDSAVCAPPPTAVDVKFSVDFFEKQIAPTGVYLGASFDGWSGAIQMTDPDGDLVFEAVINLEPGTYQYRFINGQNWAEPEILDPASTACDISAGGNRVLVLDGSGNVDLAPPCFGVCEACEPHHSVTFQVDMSEQTVAPSGVFMGAGFEGWAGGLKLEDPEGDNIYSKKIALRLGRYEFKYINGANWAAPESIDSTDTSCSVTSNENTNRVIVVDTADIVLNASCFNRCENCAGSTGLSDFDKDNSFFRLFPNPTTDFVQISFSDLEFAEKHIQILDINGRQMIASELDGRNREFLLNTQNYAPGIYFVVVQMGQKIGTHKLILRP